MITNRLPYVEKAIRMVFKKLNVEFSENQTYGCCPEPNGIKNYNKYMHELAACRNLAIAEKGNHNIITPCNGCFETLKASASEISINHKLRDKINEDLAFIDLKVDGELEVQHLLEYFHKNIGLGMIQDAVEYPLYGLRVAVHYGCHFLRPSNKIQTDSPLDPHIFDELVEALGAKSIQYDDKMMCCGGSFERAGKRDLGLQSMKHKLDKISSARADVIVVNCPQCFTQFDFQQINLKKMEYEYDIPVLYYPELLAIALGFSAENLGIDKHKVNVDSIFAKIEQKRKANLKIQENFNLDFLKTCSSCAACENDCPVARFSDFSPKSFVDRILNGDIDSAIEDPEIWACLDCYLCYELCPSKIGLVDIFTTLRNMAAERGLVSDGFKTEYNSFLNSGMVGKYSISQRKKQDLPIKPPKVDDLVKLMNIVEERDIKKVDNSNTKKKSMKKKKMTKKKKTVAKKKKKTSKSKKSKKTSKKKTKSD